MELTCDRAAGHNSRSLGRFVSSTIIGEAVDTCIFFPIGFLGVISTFDLAKTMVTVYAAKILYEVAALPLSTRAANWVKNKEHVDQLDDPNSTNYSPLLQG